MTAPGILWLTRDFRLHDNPALQAAIADGPLLPVFIIDRLTMTQGAASRWRLMRALQSLDATLRQRTGGKGITILRGEADEILPPLMKRLGVRRLHQSDWPTSEMRTLQGRMRAGPASGPSSGAPPGDPNRQWGRLSGLFPLCAGSAAARPRSARR